MQTRINKLRKKLKQNNLTAIFITSKINRAYLTNFAGSRGDLLITKNKAYLFTDSRYSERARQETDSSVNPIRKASIISGIKPSIATILNNHPTSPEDFSNGVKIITVDKDYFKTVKSFLDKLRIKKLGIEADSISLQSFDNLKKNWRGIRLVKTYNLVKEIRALKDEQEIKDLKKAIKITDNCFAYICKFIKKNFTKGLTEKQIAWEMEKFIRENGGDGLSFDSIVASGKNSAIPHHLTGKRKIKKHDLALLDFGALVNGYHADMTRTIFIGQPSKKQIEVYNAVLKVRQEMIKKVKAGVVGEDLDKEAKQIVEQLGYKDKFVHGLGHGVGLEIHEWPSLSLDKDGREIKFKENMFFTVEPGIYLTGWGGVRIEDIILATKKGVKVLSKSPKELNKMIIEI